MKLINPVILVFAFLGIYLLTNCKAASDDEKPADKHSNTAAMKDDGTTTIQPDWAKNAVIYELNTRQFSENGTFSEVTAQLPRLKKLGVDIIWFMPIFPISEKNRKATGDVLVDNIRDPEERKKYQGSPYAVADFKKVNPDYGSKADFKTMVDKIHSLGMKIILDWVPNHTGWDHPWIESNRDFYTQVDGKIIDPIDYNTGESWGWTDVADLNYDNKEMRKAMIADMKYWITDMNIDGFRMDVAHGVPNDFWVECSKELRAAGEVYMLAEGEVPEQRNSGSFASDYGWSLHHLLNEIAKGKKKASAIDEWYKADSEKYTRGYHMNFTSNHDENTWAGTVKERMGNAGDAMAVFTFTFEGMPLIYNGQEASLNKRLEFFERDPIEWGNYNKSTFYHKLTELKHKNQALANGEFGGKIQKLATTDDENIYAFAREKNGDKVITIINMSKSAKEIDIDLGKFAGGYSNVFEEGSLTLPSKMTLKMAPWEYLVFSNK